MTLEALPNVVAMFSSAAAMIALGLVIPRLGGHLGAMLRLVIVGVFLSVFLHAGFELAATFGAVSARALMVTMGVLVSVGSVSFCAAGIVGLRALR
jgi:hypothetical protein